MRSIKASLRVSKTHFGIMAAGVALLMGGCSADIARFDFPPSVSFNDGAATGAIPAPTEPVRARSNLMGTEGTSAPAAYSDAAASPGYSPSGTYGTNRDPSVASSALPEARPAAPTAPIARSAPPVDVATATPQPYQPGAAPPVTAPAASAPVVEPITHGEQIEVQQGDTLYGLSRRHQVSLNDLMNANNLTNPNLKPGQKLVLPATRTARPPLSRTAPEPVQAAEAPASWTGSYTVQAGDSLYQISRQHNVKLADLQRYNGISDVRRVKPGVVLKLPAGSGAAIAANAPLTSAPQSTAETVTPVSVSPAASAPIVSGAQPTIINSTNPPATERVAALEKPATTTDAVSAPSGSGSVASTSKLRWPVEGKIISGFGPRLDGTHNDGVNVAVPMGTDIHAAESGVVAYAGNELKGYGNLILVRHDNGWVTAYAHADELLVKRNDQVKRGQVIGKSGKTGQVDQPQVHFEVRQGQKPVDPTPFMEKM
jgi:murein DD-endopeptidase MepM/ murein hydrolase activator NlpD